MKIIVRLHLARRQLRSAQEVPMAPGARLQALGEHAHRTAATEDDRTRDALQRLPGKQRAVLVLRSYEDLDDAEIGRCWGARPRPCARRRHGPWPSCASS